MIVTSTRFTDGDQTHRACVHLAYRGYKLSLSNIYDPPEVAIFGPDEELLRCDPKTAAYEDQHVRFPGNVDGILKAKAYIDQLMDPVEGSTPATTVQSIWSGRTIRAIKAVREDQETSLLSAKRLVEKHCLVAGIRELQSEGKIDTRLGEILTYLVDRLPL